MTWEANEGDGRRGESLPVSGYILRVLDADDGSEVTQQNHFKDKLKTSIKGLVPNARYQVQIAAVNALGASGYSVASETCATASE